MENEAEKEAREVEKEAEKEARGVEKEAREVEKEARGARGVEMEKLKRECLSHAEREF